MGLAADRETQGARALVPERLLVSLLAVGTVAALLVFRWADDNRLTSWRWAFDRVSPARLYALVVAGVALAHLVARLPIPRRRPDAVLFLSSYAIAACFWGEPEVIVDAARYFTQAKHLEVYGVRHFLTEWGRGILAWTDLPLVPFLYGLVFKVLGEARIWIQAFTTLLFAASVVLTHRIGRALWNDELGFAAGALLLAIPYLFTQVPAMLVDVPAMFFLTLAIFSVIAALQRGGARRILLASLAVFLAILSKYSIWLLLSVLPLIAIVYRRAGAPRPLATAALIVLVAGGLTAAFMLFRRDVYAEQLALLSRYQGPGLRRWGESFTSTFLFQIHPFVTAAAALSVWMAVRRRDARYVIVAWPMLLLLLLQVRRARYLVPAFPMLALMAAYGLQTIRSAEVRRLVLACTVASALVVAGYGYLPFLERTSAVNLKKAGEYLDRIEEDRAEVYTRARPDSEVNQAVSVPILDLFTRKKLIYRDPRSPPPASMRVEQSPLRFTWEYRSPAYYAGDAGGGNAAVVVISGEVGQPLSAELERRLHGYRLARAFADTDGIFQHATIVDVYRAAPPSREPLGNE